VKEALWLRQLLCDSGCQCDKAIVVKVDNQSAIEMIRNPEFHKRNEHELTYAIISCVKRKKKEKNTPAGTPRFISNPAR